MNDEEYESRCCNECGCGPCGPGFVKKCTGPKYQDPDEESDAETEEEQFKWAAVRRGK